MQRKQISTLFNVFFFSGSVSYHSREYHDACVFLCLSLHFLTMFLCLDRGSCVAVYAGSESSQISLQISYGFGTTLGCVINDSIFFFRVNYSFKNSSFLSLHVFLRNLTHELASAWATWTTVLPTLIQKKQTTAWWSDGFFMSQASSHCPNKPSWATWTSLTDSSWPE